MTTTTSGAADLPEALTEYLEAQDALDNREYAGINAEPYEKLVRSRNHARAALESTLAAGQATAAPAQPAAQQGVAYAALPTSSYAGRVYEEGFLIGTCPLYTADQLHAFADATHALRASHGQAPAETGNSVSARADSVLEDAADPLQGAANWLAEAHGQFSPVVLSGCLMIGYNRAKRLHDAALAARKQGEKQ